MCERSRSFYIRSTVANFSYIFRLRNDKACPVYIQCHLWCSIRMKDEHTLIYDGTIPFQYLITVVAMQDSTLSETGSKLVFVK